MGIRSTMCDNICLGFFNKSQISFDSPPELALCEHELLQLSKKIMADTLAANAKKEKELKQCFHEAMQGGAILCVTSGKSEKADEACLSPRDKQESEVCPPAPKKPRMQPTEV